MAKRERVGVNTHGHCFDGLVSAFLFTELLEKLRGDRFDFKYRSCGYGPKMRAVPERWLDADINAILDFRYTKSDKLTFYFDHHVTAFDDENARKAAERGDREGARVIFDPTYSSCAKLIVDQGRSRFDVDLSSWSDLTTWADRIDAASFASAEEALGDAPCQRLAQIVEHHGDGPFLERTIAALRKSTVEALVETEEMKSLHAPIAAERERFRALVGERASVAGDTVTADLSDSVFQAAGKFVTYAMYPETLYSVVLLRTKNLYKISVGKNPWSEAPRRHDIAAICKAEGGGGHPVVGAASFGLDDREGARSAMKRIVEALAR